MYSLKIKTAVEPNIGSISETVIYEDFRGEIIETIVNSLVQSQRMIKWAAAIDSKTGTDISLYLIDYLPVYKIYQISQLFESGDKVNREDIEEVITGKTYNSHTSAIKYPLLEEYNDKLNRA